MAKGQRESEQPNKMPVQPIDCREALHWFVETVGLYKGSTRGLLVSNFDEAAEPYVESAVINLKSRGITPAVVEGAAIYQQAARLWDQAVRGTSFGRPVATQFELDLTGAPVTVINNFTPPQTAQQLWYLYHHILYPRALNGKPLLITTKHDYYELISLGGHCEDLEYAGRKVTWEKVLYILEATTIDLHHFSQMKEEGLPPMLKAEYYLYKTLKAREFPITPMHVVGDYMLDFAIFNRHSKLDVEIDNVSSLDGGSSYSAEAKKNLELLSDGWRIVRLTNSEIMSNVVACADAVEDVWRGGLKKSSFGRLIQGNSSYVVPELVVEDEVQRMAISHGAGPAAITGGAGCGKTTVLAHRVVNLLKQGINPESILVISYSKETLTPLRAMVDEIGDKIIAQKVNFFTWHELGLKILKENLSAIKRKPPLKVEQNVLKVIQRLLQKYKKDLDPVTLELSEELDEFTLVSLISLYKANLVAPKHVKERGKGDVDELVAKVFQAYEDQLQKANRVDRDDMITLSANLLVENADVRARYQYQFEYVLIDEYQDASAAMDLLARLLSFPQDNLFILGDEDLTIWEAKGSLPRLLPEVSLRLPNARCYTLDKNWRCHPAIVENARHVVRALERRRMQKDFTTGWGPAPTEAVIGPQILADEMAESEWVADEVQILIDSGRQSGEIVVLYRQNSYAILIEEALSRRNIRCIATHPDAGMIPDEVGDVMAFLRLVMDPDGPKARESFERICQLRVKEVDPKLSATIASFGEANNLSYLKAVEIYSEAVSDPSCIDLAQLVRIIRTMHAEKLPPAETISLLKRTQRLNEFYKSIKVPAGVNYEPLRKLAQLEEEARQYKSVSEFVKTWGARQQDKGEGNEGPVRILNVNETKGLEYPIVFVVGMSDGLFPSDVNDLEEERRLFYLAITRTREALYLSSPSSFNGESLLPSFFLAEGGFQLAAPKAGGQPLPVVPAAAPPPPPPPPPPPATIAPVEPKRPAKPEQIPVKPDQIPVKPDPGVVKPVARTTQQGGATAAIPVKPDPGMQPVTKPNVAPTPASNIPVLPDPGMPTKAPAQSTVQPVQQPAQPQVVQESAPLQSTHQPVQQPAQQPVQAVQQPASPPPPPPQQPQIQIVPVKPVTAPMPSQPQTLPPVQPSPPQTIPVRQQPQSQPQQAPPVVAAQSAPAAIPVKPDPGLVNDDLPVVIKPVVSKPVAESIPIRPDPVLDELLAPLQQSAAARENTPPPAMPHVLPNLPTAQTASQAPQHTFSSKPLEAPDPLFQATQQNVLQHMAPAQPSDAAPSAPSAPETKEAAGIKYNVFGIPIGPDEEPLIDDKSAPEVAGIANQAIVNEAAKAAARTHPGLPAGFVIPDPNPAQLNLPKLKDLSIFKPRPHIPANAIGLPPAATPLAPAPLVAPPPSATAEIAASVAVPSPAAVSSATSMAPDPAATAAAAETPIAPAKGRKGRKGKTVEVAAETTPAVPELAPTANVSEPPAVTQPPTVPEANVAKVEAKPAAPVEHFAPVPEPIAADVDIVAAAAAAAFGQLPADDVSPLQAAVKSQEPEVDEEGFIIQTFVAPVNVGDAKPSVAQPPAVQPQAAQPPAPNPWDSPMQPPPPPPPPTLPHIQAPPLQTGQPIQATDSVQPAGQAQKPLLQQWSSQGKEHSAETPDLVKQPGGVNAMPPQPGVPTQPAASIQQGVPHQPAVQEPIAAQAAEPPVGAEPAAPEEPPLPPSAFHSHEHIVGDKYQTGAGEHHRGSWMEQGPTPIAPNLSVPLPAGHDPDKPKDIGAPVRKGPQRPQISPLYPESFQSPVEMPATPPAPPAAPPVVSEGGVYNAVGDDESLPGMGAVPAVPDNIGKKGKNVAWGGIKGGLSRGQRSEDVPQVYKDMPEETQAESAFPEVAARPMLPQTPLQGAPHAQYQPPQAIPQQPVQPHGSVQQPVQSFAQGDDDAPHCPECSARLEGGSNFCGECGYKLGVRIPTCVSCQAPLDPTARFCGECGTKVTDPAAGANPAPESAPLPNSASQNASQDPEKAMEDYLSGFGPNQKDKHWSNKLKKILD